MKRFVCEKSMNNHSEIICSWKQLSSVVPSYSLYAGSLRLKGLLSFVSERFAQILKLVRQKTYSVMFFTLLMCA